MTVRISVCVFGCLWLLPACRAGFAGSTVSPTLYEITSSTAPDTSRENRELAALIAPYAAGLDSVMNRVIGMVKTPLRKDRPESSLGNWTADLIKAAADDLFPDREVAFAVQNYGGLRIAEIGSGPLIVSEIYELMPFDNELVLVELTGVELQSFLEHTLADGGWPVSEGLSAERRQETVTARVRGAPIDPTRVYFIAVPDYVANGGSDSRMLVGKPQVSSGRMIRDLLLEYAERLTTPISVAPDGSRIKIIDP